MTPRRPYSRHGLNGLMARVKLRGLHAIDQRTAAARALVTWRTELVADLGGESALSAQQRALVETAVRTRLFLEHLDAWLLAQPSLINARRRSVLPVFRERLQLADALGRQLAALGLERHQPKPAELGEYLAKYRPAGKARPPRRRRPRQGCGHDRDPARRPPPHQSKPARLGGCPPGGGPRGAQRHCGGRRREGAGAEVATSTRKPGPSPPRRRFAAGSPGCARPSGPSAVPFGPGRLPGSPARRGMPMIMFPTTPASFLLPSCLMCGTRDAEGTWAVLVERVDVPSPGRFSVPCRATEHRTFCPRCAARYPDPLGEWKRRQAARR